MRALDRIVVALLVATVGFAVVFLAHPPVPKYYPLERAWHLVQPGEDPGMGWYGRSGVALLAGAVLAGIARVLMRRKPFSDKSGFSAKTVWGITAVVIATLLVLTVAVIHEQRPWFANPARTLDSLESGSVAPAKRLQDERSNAT